jgi:hypothetical protein
VSSGHDERSASGMYRHCTSKPAAVRPGSCGDMAWAQAEHSLSNTGGVRRHSVRSRSMCSNAILMLVTKCMNVRPHVGHPLTCPVPSVPEKYTSSAAVGGASCTRACSRRSCSNIDYHQRGSCEGSELCKRRFRMQM